jgi:hypothetical protein
VSRKNTFLLLSAIVALAAASYTSARFVREMGDKTLGVRRGSVSETQSRADGFYVGRYTPARRLVALKTPSTLTVPDAWVEHAWKRELSLALREKKRVAEGYYVYIPIPADESPNGRKPIWEFGFTLELQQGDAGHPSYRGTGFDSGLGFMIFVDTLPETLTFAVKQKQSGANDTITDTIEFKRAF